MTAVGSSGKWLVHTSDESTLIPSRTPPEFFFINNLLGMRVPDAFGFRVEPANLEHPEIIERCIAYFHRLVDLFDLKALRKADMWGTSIEQGHKGFEEALLKRDSETVSSMLINVADTPLGWGFMSSPDPNNWDIAWSASLHVMDKVVALANAFGYPVVCPEQGAQNAGHLDLEQLLDFISEHTALEAPAAGGREFGLRTKNGVLTERDLIAIYIASRIDSMLHADDPVCEIGGGAGTQAFHLARKGISVSVFDLPTVSILQSYFLMTSLGAEQVWVYGETPNPSARVRVLPWWELETAPDDEFALVLNVDSLPEIEAQAAREYIRLFHKKAALFFSVNQEARAINTDSTYQNVVSQLVKEHGGFKRTLRFPFWMRAGYVEEVYERLK